jgi:hypothetical protein
MGTVHWYTMNFYFNSRTIWSATTISQRSPNLYKNMYVNLTIGAENVYPTQLKQQGNNMAPALFLFPMQSFAENL